MHWHHCAGIVSNPCPTLTGKDASLYFAHVFSGPSGCRPCPARYPVATQQMRTYQSPDIEPRGRRAATVRPPRRRRFSKLSCAGVIFTALVAAGSFHCVTPFDAILGLAVPPGGPTEPLSTGEVLDIITQAAAALADDRLVIAVADREGNVLGLFRKSNAPATVSVLLAGRLINVDANELAVSLARTGAFFSNDQAPLSSRTVRFISREHFPPTIAPSGIVTGVKNTPPGALWDIENTNKGCTLSAAYIPGQEIQPPMSIDRTGPSLGVATIPGGVPLFRAGKLVGGIGVTGADPDFSEFAAFSGAAGAGFGPTPASPGEIFIDGIRLPFVKQDFLEPVLTTPGALTPRRPLGTVPDLFANLADVGAFVTIPDLNNPALTVTDAQASLRPNVPEGWLVGPLGSPELSSIEVAGIVEQAIIQANLTRAAIRLPLNQSAKMVIAVSNLNGDVIGLYRMPDATVFSIDVAATKARNVIYFSSFGRTPLDLPGVPYGTAVTTRTLRFGSQPFFPQGIDDTLPGPFALLRLHNQDNPCTQGFAPPGPNQSGVVFFPGSVPLYRAGIFLIGGLGVSGDGVDQDDLVSAAGGRGYEPIPNILADNVTVSGVRLPYLRFPRSPQEGL